jgi:hypothetical protein
MSEERIRELIEAFDHFDNKYKRAEVEEAVTLREEITPHLIRILKELAADPRKYADEEHYANTYAVALLAHFREPAAHLPIIRAFSIGKEEIDLIWGDMVTETLPALLFQTCNGSLEAIKALIHDRDANEYVRGAAGEALTYAVARGEAKREEIVEFLSGLFTGEEAEVDSDFWCEVASSIADLHPEGAMDVIRRAYQDGLVYDTYVGLEEIEEDLLRDKEETLDRLREKVDYRVPTDVHKYISEFACFNEHESGSRKSMANPVLKREKIKKKANRARSKIAKKAKRKNRK